MDLIGQSNQGDLGSQGDEGSPAFFQIKMYQICQKRYVQISFEDLCEKGNFAKFRGCCLKIKPAMPISILSGHGMLNF